MGEGMASHPLAVALWEPESLDVSVPSFPGISPGLAEPGWGGCSWGSLPWAWPAGENTAHGWL